MARKPESLFWDRVRPLLAGLHPVRIENSASVGVPDVNITLGWIELKQVKAENMPKREATTLRLEHFTPQQRAWLAGRMNAGGACWLLLLLGDEWLLFRGMDAALSLGHLTVEATRSLACARWTEKPDIHSFQEALRKRLA
jgi:hypothetical protein